MASGLLHSASLDSTMRIVDINPIPSTVSGALVPFGRGLLITFRILALLVLAFIMSGCRGDDASPVESTTERPVLYYVGGGDTGDLTEYSEIADLVSRFFVYRKIRFSGEFDEDFAQRNYARLKANPRFDRSIDYWEYLERRDPPGKLTSTDIATIKKFDIKRIPVVMVQYPDGDVVKFEKQMSGEMFFALLQQRRDGSLSASEMSDVLDSWWNIQDPDDRPELVGWLENAILR